MTFGKRVIKFEPAERKASGFWQPKIPVSIWLPCVLGVMLTILFVGYQRYASSAADTFAAAIKTFAAATKTPDKITFNQDEVCLRAVFFIQKRYGSGADIAHMGADCKILSYLYPTPESRKLTGGEGRTFANVGIVVARGVHRLPIVLMASYKDDDPGKGLDDFVLYDEGSEFIANN
jgi:hypothetical protein